MTCKRLLLIDDDHDYVSSLAQALGALRRLDQIYTATDAEQAAQVFAEHSPQVVVLDLCLEEAQGVKSGFALQRKLLSCDSACRIIVLTGHGRLEFGVQALQSGAANFLEKPADIQHLLALIEDGFSQAELRKNYNKLVAEKQDSVHTLLVGDSPEARDLGRQVQFAASTNQAVLLTGETGTGKGLCASVIHQLSMRALRPFVRYQPTFQSADLATSELFGHQRGAFTGAHEARKGLLAEAEGGTLFLDEIDELPPQMQIMLLGVLQEKRFRQLGSSIEQQVDVRLIAATNADIDQVIEQGKLRLDLYHRIAHCRIHIVPLRDRRDDIQPLAEHCLKRLVEREQLNVLYFSPEVFMALRNYDWPGNVRELAAQVESAVYRAHFARHSSVELQDLADLRDASSQSFTAFSDLIGRYKLRVVTEALCRAGNNQVRAAQDLRMNRSSLRRILKQSSKKMSSKGILS